MRKSLRNYPDVRKIINKGIKVAFKNPNLAMSDPDVKDALSKLQNYGYFGVLKKCDFLPIECVGSFGVEGDYFYIYPAFGGFVSSFSKVKISQSELNYIKIPKDLIIGIVLNKIKFYPLDTIHGEESELDSYAEESYGL